MSNPFEDEARKRAAGKAWEAAHGMPLLAKRIIMTIVLLVFGAWCLGQDEYIPVVFSLPLCLIMLVVTWIAPRSWFYWD